MTIGTFIPLAGSSVFNLTSHRWPHFREKQAFPFFAFRLVLLTSKSLQSFFKVMLLLLNYEKLRAQ